MVRPRAAVRSVLVPALLLLLLTSTVAAGATSPAAPASSHAPSSGDATRGPPTAGAARPASAGSTATPAGDVRAPLVAQVERQISAGEFNGRNAFLPSAYTSRAQPPAGGAVSVEPLVAPAPMGLADLGIGTGGTPYAYGTTSFQGTIEIGSFTAYSPGYAEFAEAPDWTTIQLNAVGVNISYPGASNGVFWFQNVAHFNGTELQLEDNIWNFSSYSALLTPGTLYHHGKKGIVELDEFYYDYGPEFAVTYPFTLSLSVTLEEVGLRPSVLFNYTITNGSGPAGASKTYDNVTFNGTVVGPPKFLVNGAEYNPYGNQYDAELILGGDGGGTNANIQSFQGNATLSRWDAGTDRYVSVPSAYDHGVDSGETSTGLAEYYLTHRTTAYLDQGPSLLYGLWNTSSGFAGPAATPGYLRVDLTIAPAYAFGFATYADDADLGLVRANFSYAPMSRTGALTTELPPAPAGDPYVFGVWADGYQNTTVTVKGNSTGTASFALTASSDTFDAPVYLDGNAQAALFGAAGIAKTGYAKSGPTLWINATEAALVAPFLRVNDFDYPTFVLFAGERLNLTVLLDRFAQAPSSFVYTSSYPFVGPAPTTGWTQGYYFFYGSGRFAVANTTVTGDTALYYQSIAAPGAVEFYDTVGSSVANLKVSDDSFGLAAVDAASVTAENVSSFSGSNGVSAINSTGVTVTDLRTNGTDSEGTPSLGAYDYGSTAVVLGDVHVTNGSIGIFGQSGTGLEVTGLTVVTVSPTELSYGIELNRTDDVRAIGVTLDASIGLEANDSSVQSLIDVRADYSPGVALWSNGTDLSVTGLTAQNESYGVQFQNDSAVTVQNAVAENGSIAVWAFANSTGGTFRNVFAANESVGLETQRSMETNLYNVTALNGSVGAELENTSFVKASGVAVRNLSDGLLWNFGSRGSIENVTVGNASLGVGVSNATNFTVGYVAAAEAALGPNTTYYFLAPISYRLQPSAAVALYDAAYATVENVSARYYPFAVAANFTNDSRFENVSAWYGYAGIWMNGTLGNLIAGSFFYGNDLGVYLGYSNGTLVSANTFEASASFGISILNGTLVHVDGNNFVANNGADTKGTYSAAHVQASSVNGSRIYFNGTGFGNFWSDHSGATPYTIHTLPAVLEDHDPLAAFVSNWLKFVAQGLPTGVPWGFAIDGTNYTATVPLVYLPAAFVPDQALAWTALPTPGYVPTPASGTAAALDGHNETVTIDFATLWTVTFTESNLPVGTAWSVTLNLTPLTSTTSSIVFHELNGTLPYTIGGVAGWSQSTLPRTGTVVVDGANVNEKTIAWNQVTYAVTFSESGLPSKLKWTVTVDGVEKSLTTDGGTDSLSFAAPNGSIPYVVTDLSGWAQATLVPTGSIPVNGAAVTEPTLVYTEVVYTVTFTETDLPTGTNWSVTLNGVTESSTGAAVFFSVPNGSYHYKIGVPSGYSTGTGSGTISVNGAAASLVVPFASTHAPAAFPWLYVGAGVAAALVVVGLVAVVLRRRRGRRPRSTRYRPASTETQPPI